VRELEKDSSPVASAGVAPRGAAMLHVVQQLQPAPDYVVRSRATYMRHKPDATRIMLM
jgi:hypothetical protein